MPVLNLGSINVDVVFSVPRIVRPGETLAARGVRRVAGGKGANQSIALARAGASVRHVGRVGTDGTWIVALLAEAGVDVAHVVVDADAPTGSAFIQVADDGENAIVLDAGANARLTEPQIEAALARAAPDDWLLVQNEVNDVGRWIAMGRSRGMRIAFNPAPMSAGVAAYPLDEVELMIVNEIEAEALTGVADPEAALARLPGRERIVTLGPRGALYLGPDGRFAAPAPRVDAVVDTTAAGDTFVGYFLAGREAGRSTEDALALACRAASLCVGRAGAIPSIPTLAEVVAAEGLRRRPSS